MKKIEILQLFFNHFKERHWVKKIRNQVINPIFCYFF